MKLFQRFTGILCTCCILVACVAPALAAEPAAMENYAYMDINTAAPQLREQILAARCEIVYAPDAGWSVDGNASVVHADGTVEVLPKFSDLFPGWNLTEISAYRAVSYRAGADLTRALVPKLEDDEIGYYYYHSVSLAVTTSGNYFCSFNAESTMGRVRAETLPGSKWSAAVRNENTYQEEAYKGNMALEDTLDFTTVNNVRYSVRASSPDKAGDAMILVAIVG